MSRPHRLFTISAAAAVALTALVTPAVGSAFAASGSDSLQQAQAAAVRAMKPPSRITQTVPLRVPGPKGRSVIFFHNGTAGSEIISQGIAEAAKAGSWKYSTLKYDSANPATLQAAMSTALQQKPAGVIVSGEEQTTWGESVTRAYAQANTPIITTAACPVKQVATIYPGAGLCPDAAAIGRVLADWFIADSGGKGHALLETLPLFRVFSVLRDGFVKEVAAKCPGCTVTNEEITLAQIGAGQVPSLLVNKLRQNPDITYLFFDFADWSTGIQPALAAAGLEGKIKVGGNGMNEAALAALKANQQAVWSTNSLAAYGYGSFDSLLRVLTKSPGIVKNAAQPFQLVTPANANAVTLPYRAPKDALAQYKKLWKW